MPTAAAKCRSRFTRLVKKVVDKDFERQRSAFEQQRWQYQWPFFDFDGAWLCAAATTATKSMATDDAHESSSLWPEQRGYNGPASRSGPYP
ncbi:unnamed protein product [Durusdinium trenchii]|uniref:Uncharacterized protein n=1 Tax=Durusdinium trenchii TaxID=1381693 RepID=A0ABP0S593_9DINO